MCRFLAYIGAPILMDKLLYQPANSLIRQSYKAQEREEPLNGDGFGVGWYVPAIDATPAVFVSVRPAWNNKNLRYIAPKIRSNCIFAHVRAASTGDVAEDNCHPFHYKNLLFMHNGNIKSFSALKRSLRQRLSDEIYNWIKGETDSEHFFALFLNALLKNGNGQSSQNFVTSLEETIAELRELTQQQGIHEPFFLNVAMTNGKFMVATRYVSDPDLNPPTLYHSEGSRYECYDGVCKMERSEPSEHAVLIVSEKLTDLEEDWHEVPPNHFVVVSEDLSVSIVPILV
ncbi:MAG: class II glutamine amidotransferase [bacterium]